MDLQSAATSLEQGRPVNNPLVLLQNCQGFGISIKKHVTVAVLENSASAISVGKLYQNEYHKSRSKALKDLLRAKMAKGYGIAINEDWVVVVLSGPE